MPSHEYSLCANPAPVIETNARRAAERRASFVIVCHSNLYGATPAMVDKAWAYITNRLSKAPNEWAKI